MPRRLRQFVALTTLAQVLLIGVLGTGLHGLFGCEHRRCTAACCETREAAASGCDDCVFCLHAEKKQRDDTSPKSRHSSSDVAVVSSHSDGCAVCDLLGQFNTVTPIALEPLPIELSSGEAALQQQNAVVAAAIRLALSRGPPCV